MMKVSKSVGKLVHAVFVRCGQFLYKTKPGQTRRQPCHSNHVIPTMSFSRLAHTMSSVRWLTSIRVSIFRRKSDAITAKAEAKARSPKRNRKLTAQVFHFCAFFCFWFHYYCTVVLSVAPTDVQKHLHVEWDPASGTFKVSTGWVGGLEGWTQKRRSRSRALLFCFVLLCSFFCNAVQVQVSKSKERRESISACCMCVCLILYSLLYTLCTLH